jgi:hypothetical protein
MHRLCALVEFGNFFEFSSGILLTALNSFFADLWKIHRSNQTLHAGHFAVISSAAARKSWYSSMLIRPIAASMNVSASPCGTILFIRTILFTEALGSKKDD